MRKEMNECKMVETRQGKNECQSLYKGTIPFSQPLLFSLSYIAQIH